jgi:hypothetical protein
MKLAPLRSAPYKVGNHKVGLIETGYSEIGENTGESLFDDHFASGIVFLDPISVIKNTPLA